MKTRLPAVAAILILLLIATAFMGCGEETKTSGTGPGVDTASVSASADIPDPCSLVTKADAEAILGEPVGAATSIEMPGQRGCTYNATGAFPRTVNVQVIKPCSMADATNYTTPGAEMVEGIGMHGWWDKTVLTVHTTADVCVIASGGGAPGGAVDDAVALENAKKAANMIIEKMGIQEPGM